MNAPNASFSMVPALAGALATWLDPDNPDAETPEGLLREAASGAASASMHMTLPEIEQSVRWLAEYLAHEDRQITNALCDITNQDWTDSPEGMNQLRNIMEVVHKTLQAMELKRRQQEQPAW